MPTYMENIKEDNQNYTKKQNWFFISRLVLISHLLVVQSSIHYTFFLFCALIRKFIILFIYLLVIILSTWNFFNSYRNLLK